MKSKRLPHTQNHINGVRLIRQEMFRIEQGLSRYLFRASSLANDIVPPSNSCPAAELAKIESSIQRILDKLAERIACHDQ